MICIDSSVVVKWFLPEELSEQADALRRAAAHVAEAFVAPLLLGMEVNNVIFKRTRRPNPIDYDTAAHLLNSFLNEEINFRDPAALHRNALELATTFRLPAIYDAYYLALCIQEDCIFWTADKRLIEALDSRLPFVHWIGHFPL